MDGCQRGQSKGRRRTGIELCQESGIEIQYSVQTEDAENLMGQHRYHQWRKLWMED